MQGNERVIEQLNTTLASELTAIVQYMTQSERYFTRSRKWASALTSRSSCMVRNRARKFWKTTEPSNNTYPNGFHDTSYCSRRRPANPNGAENHNRFDERRNGNISFRSLAGTESSSARIRRRQRHRTFLCTENRFVFRYQFLRLPNGILARVEEAGAIRDGSVIPRAVPSVKPQVGTMQFDCGQLSPYFVTDHEGMEVAFENVYILIHEKKISSKLDLLPLFEQVSKMRKPLLIIAEDLGSKALASLVVSKLRGPLQVAAG